MVVYVLVREDGSYITNRYNAVVMYATYEEAERASKALIGIRITSLGL